MFRPSLIGRTAALAGAVTIASCLVAACGSSGPGQAGDSPSDPVSSTSPPVATAPASSAPASTAPVTGTSAPPSATPLCRTSSLVISLDVTQAGGGAGSEYFPLDFTSTSATACELYGFPGISFVTAASAGGRQTGAAAVRAGAFGKLAIRLAPGQTAHAWLKVAVADNYPASTCRPVTVHWLRVYPPGEKAAGYVNHTFTACSSAAVTQLTVLPVRAGQAVADVTP